MKQILIAFALFFNVLHAREIQIVPVQKTAQSEEAVLRLIFPRPYENKRRNPISIQMRLERFSLGKRTPNARSQELFNFKEGQAIHVIVDNEPCFSINEAIEKPGEKKGADDALISFPLKVNLKSGQHVLRAFPVTSYGESMKGKGSFVSEIFYFQDKKKSDTLNVNLRKPYITYNVPEGRYPAHQSSPMLLDFYLSNCTLSPDGYKVRITIDGKPKDLLTKWVPYFIYGLTQGTHRIRLELLDKQNQLVPGFFNSVEREVVIN